MSLLETIPAQEEENNESEEEESNPRKKEKLSETDDMQVDAGTPEEDVEEEEHVEEPPQGSDEHAGVAMVSRQKKPKNSRAPPVPRFPTDLKAKVATHKKHASHRNVRHLILEGTSSPISISLCLPEGSC